MLLNSFSNDTKNLWIHEWACQLCRRRQAVEFHHIAKRGGTKRNKLMDSPYNCAFLCRLCRDMGSVHHKEVRNILLMDTDIFLKQQGYKKTEKDKEFLQYIKTI